MQQFYKWLECDVCGQPEAQDHRAAHLQDLPLFNVYQGNCSDIYMYVGIYIFLHHWVEKTIFMHFDF